MVKIYTGCPKTSGQLNFEGYRAPHASSNFYWPGNDPVKKCIFLVTSYQD